MTMDMLGFIDLTSLPALIILVECFFLLFIGKMVFDISTPQFRVARQLGEQKNAALGVTMAMYYLALAIVVTGVAGEGAVGLPVAEPIAGASAAAAIDWPEVQAALRDVAIWGIVGIVLLGAARVTNDRLILHQFNTTKEIIEDKNVGTGVVEGAAYIASAFIIRACVIGEGTGNIGAALGLTAMFFLLSQVMLAVFTVAYQRFTKYDLHAEIERDNVAVGVGLAGPLIALGIVLGAGQHFIAGDETVPWQVLSFVVVSVIAIILLMVFKYLSDWMILTKIDLDKELSANQNVAVACVAAVLPIALAAFVAACWTG